MIRYNLSCAEGHAFDSWFQSAAAFDRLAASGMVTCSVCGSTEVVKAPMAPAVSGGEAAPRDPAPLSAPKTPAEQALAALRKHVESTADYVGPRFAREARAIHDGERPERPIYGEAKPDEARALIEDGIPVAPLPFRPRGTSS